MHRNMFPADLLVINRTFLNIMIIVKLRSFCHLELILINNVKIGTLRKYKGINNVCRRSTILNGL